MHPESFATRPAASRSNARGFPGPYGANTRREIFPCVVCGSVLVRVLTSGNFGNVKCSQPRSWESAATGSQAFPGPAATPAMVGGQRVAAKRMERFASPQNQTQSRDSRKAEDEADAAKRWQLYGAVWVSGGVRFSSCLSLFASRRRRRRGEQLCRRGQTRLQTAAVVRGHRHAHVHMTSSQHGNARTRHTSAQHHRY